jgi:hypothetical protein
MARFHSPIILLFGMPRSGTTWIGKIFDSHTGTLYRHEPDTWKKINEIPFLEKVELYENYCAFIAEYIEEFTRSTKLEVNGKLPIFEKSYSSKIHQALFKGSVYLSSALSKMNNNIRLPIVRSFVENKNSDYVVVWKSIQLLGRFGIIANCMENCKGIHIIRHPCGYISSVLNGERKHKFTSSISASEDYSLYEKLINTEQAIRYEITLNGLKKLTPEERLAWRWVLFNEKAIDDTKGNPNIKVLKYEQMCNQPIETTKEYFEFCGLDWCEQTNHFLMASTDKNSNSYYSVFKNPKLASIKWKNSLELEQIKRVEKIVSNTMVGSLYKDSY